MSQSQRTPDQDAAHEFLVELRTRIATQRLPYQHGVEQRALESLHQLFNLARETAKKYPGCRVFVDTVAPALNGKIRPITAKWHKAIATGALASRDGGDAFRGDLIQLREEMCALERELRKLAYGEHSPPETSDSPVNYERELAGEIESYFGEMEFGIFFQQNHVNRELAHNFNEINDAEKAEIAARRKMYGIANVDDNGVGLALSGGGIRSATFCLGIVQVLAERNLLKEIDYLSTVSGGGYIGSFLTSHIGSGKANYSDIANPNGADSKHIAYIRQHAKYLSADLWQRWGMVTASLAGLLLNWCAPFFLLASLAFVAIFFTNHFDFAWWKYLFWGGLALSTMCLFFYAHAMRWAPSSSRLAGSTYGLSLLLTLAIAGFWLLHRYFFDFYNFVGEEGVRETAIASLEAWQGKLLGAGSLIAAIPAVMRFLPLFEKPKIRENVLKVVLLAAAFLVPVCAVLLFYVFCTLGVMNSVDIYGWSLPRGWSLYILIGIFGYVAFFLLNINLTSPHRLYRDQLAGTFVALREGDETIKPLLDINHVQHAPYHLINAAVNLPSSKSPALRDRKCDFFLMSKHWCGSTATGYAPTKNWRMNGNVPDLASAMAISGAAVSSRMGLGTIPSLSALLTFFNARLGFWIRNPLRKSVLHMNVPGFSCLLREMFGFSMSEKNAWLNLSDGGHIENMGIYELLRRRCKFIICVDGEADPDYTFPGFMTLVRHARIDFGIEIDAKLDDIRPNPETGYSQSHWGLFRVHYPSSHDTSAQRGLLLYIKSSVTGNESELIRRYRTIHPEFPHQSTLDQFFDQEQFEAYRQLGVHICEGLFLPALMSSGTTSEQGDNLPTSVKDWFRKLAYSTF